MIKCVVYTNRCVEFPRRVPFSEIRVERDGNGITINENKPLHFMKGL